MPAAALTAFARSEDRTKALQSGFEMHLAKPVDPGRAGGVGRHAGAPLSHREVAASLIGVMNIKVVVNDRMQRGYVYFRTQPVGRNFDPEFQPQLTRIRFAALPGSIAPHQRRDRGDELTRDRPAGKVHLEAVLQRLGAILGPRKRRQRRRRHVARRVRDARMRPINSKPSNSGMPMSATSTCGLNEAIVSRPSPRRPVVTSAPAASSTSLSRPSASARRRRRARERSRGRRGRCRGCGARSADARAASTPPAARSSAAAAR